MSNRHHNGPGPIPNRWLRCPIRSDSFICNKFIAFKTPLDVKFDEQVPDQFSFYPYMLFNLMKDIYKVKSSNVSLKIVLSIFYYLTRKNSVSGLT